MILPWLLITNFADLICITICVKRYFLSVRKDKILDMHSIEFDKSIIKGVKLINVEKIIIHEEIIEQKASV